MRRTGSDKPANVFRFATISRGIIKGQAIGTDDGGGDSYGIIAETVTSLKVAGLSCPTFAFVSDYYDLTASTTSDVILSEIQEPVQIRDLQLPHGWAGALQPWTCRGGSE